MGFPEQYGLEHQSHSLQNGEKLAAKSVVQSILAAEDGNDQCNQRTARVAQMDILQKQLSARF
jgi:hypothetical protein